MSLAGIVLGATAFYWMVDLVLLPRLIDALGA
jgi:hypothetical protein